MSTPIMTLEEAIDVVGTDIGTDWFHQEMSGSMQAAICGVPNDKQAATIATIFGTDEDYVNAALHDKAKIVRDGLFADQAARVTARETLAEHGDEMSEPAKDALRKIGHRIDENRKD